MTSHGHHQMLKVPAAFLIVLLAIALLTSCQSPAGSGEGAGSTQTVDRPPLSLSRPTATPTPPPHLQIDPEDLKGTTIRFLHPWAGDTGRQMQSLVNEFNQTNVWGITVQSKTTGSAGALYDLVIDGLESDRLPNLVAAPFEHLLAWRQDDNVVIVLNDYINSPQWGLQSKEIEDFFPAFWKQDQVGGRQIAIPAQRNLYLLFYNQSWAEELGFESPPFTPEDFMVQVCAATRANLYDDQRQNDGSGGWIIDNTSTTVLSWILAFEPEMLARIEDNDYRFNSPMVIQSFAFMRQLIDQQCAWTNRSPTPYEPFARRRALIYTGSLQDLMPQAVTSSRLDSQDQWIVLPYPGNEENPVLLESGFSYAMLVASPEEQLASWLFLRWLILPRHQAALIETSATLPLSASTADLLADFAKKYPQWQQALEWTALAKPAPRQPSWRIVRSILEDAAWQSFQFYIKPADIPQQLQLLDETIPEVLEKTP